MEQDLVFPDTVYHGTLDRHYPSFQQRLLAPEYWKPARDFGKGFYMTISLLQAKKWAHAMRDKEGFTEGGRPCVLQLSIRPDRFPFAPSFLTFSGPSRQWADFIYRHRAAGMRGEEPCGEAHPHIIIGPMADSDAGFITTAAVKLKKDTDWYYNEITRNFRRRSLDALGLGHQLTYSDARLEPSLALTGAYILEETRWKFYENNRSQLSHL